MRTALVLAAFALLMLTCQHPPIPCHVDGGAALDRPTEAPPDLHTDPAPSEPTPEIADAPTDTGPPTCSILAGWSWTWTDCDTDIPFTCYRDCMQTSTTGAIRLSGCVIPAPVDPDRCWPCGPATCVRDCAECP